MTRAANSARLARLEERGAELRARRAQRDEDLDVHEAVLDRLRESPEGLEGLEALEGYCSVLEASGGSAKAALRLEAGRDAIATLGALYIEGDGALREEEREAKRTR
ncbi:MAG: hypothetical protein H0U04_17980 [Rubrobacter sp.]|nr:hypothetical protein [Rubrobacter sp.]